MNVSSAVTGGLLSIIGVGMGVALGREGAPEQSGAAAASVVAGWAGLTSPQRRLPAGVPSPIGATGFLAPATQVRSHRSYWYRS